MATYRLQFTPDFGFRAAKQLVPYLAELGISDVYASPIFSAKKGSTHGYDVIDSNHLNPELGSEQDFLDLISEVKKHGMSWIQDIVPNHMAYDSQNQKLMDVLENGQASPFYPYFDIEWNHPYESIRGKVLAPFLGEFYWKSLENCQIALRYDEGGLSINYYDLKFPVRIESYPSVLTHRFSLLRKKLGRNHPDIIKFYGVLYVLRNLSTEEDTKERYDQIQFVKQMLWEFYTQNAEIRQFLDENLHIFNGKQGNRESFNLLDALLREQHFRLSFWKVATAEINYRRFFSINHLISLRMEDERVFRDTHGLIFRLLDEDSIQGLRVDHIDGLYDPGAYLQRLRDRAPDCYLVVEKILDLDEPLPEIWPIQGTTGYEFLNIVNGVFCNRQHEQRFEAIYRKFSGLTQPYRGIVHDKKRMIIGRHMAGDIDYLAQLIKTISSRDRYGSDITLHGIRRALVEVLALFPIYRTYVSPGHFTEEDQRIIRDTLQRAKATGIAIYYELEFLERFFLLHFDENLSETDKKNWIYFVMRFQQFSGPLMAKGFEDTALYVYNRLISLNEVGGNPRRFGMSPQEFHHYQEMRREHWPLALSTSATHDTKRGEDVRTRIDVLSEIPDEWEDAVTRWHDLTVSCKSDIEGEEAPTRNDEYFFYQTLIGVLPFEGAVNPELRERVQAYMLKSAREAKVNTGYLVSNERYERALHEYLDRVLENNQQNQFLNDFIPFQKKIAFYGMLISLGQTLIKMTAPGIPDFYQGGELWDLSLVDPDNRRPVDYEIRRSYLQANAEMAKKSAMGTTRELLDSFADGRIKLLTIQEVLSIRKRYHELFENGEYLPLEVRGIQQDHALAYARRREGFWSITLVPRLLASLIQPGQLPLGDDIWGNTHIVLPPEAPPKWQNVFTDSIVRMEGELHIGQILNEFPVALLMG